jgi:hypothetical protein
MLRCNGTTSGRIIDCWEPTNAVGADFGWAKVEEKDSTRRPAWSNPSISNNTIGDVFVLLVIIAEASVVVFLVDINAEFRFSDIYFI